MFVVTKGKSFSVRESMWRGCVYLFYHETERGWPWMRNFFRVLGSGGSPLFFSLGLLPCVFFFFFEKNFFVEEE